MEGGKEKRGEGRDRIVRRGWGKRVVGREGRESRGGEESGGEEIILVGVHNL